MYQAVWAQRMSRASDFVVCWSVWLSSGEWEAPQQNAADMRHILLVLPFLLPDLVLPEVQEYNRQNPREPLVDSSSDAIASEVTLLLSIWYRLFRRCYPPKVVDDIKELHELGYWYLKCSKYIWMYLIIVMMVWIFLHFSAIPVLGFCAATLKSVLIVWPRTFVVKEINTSDDLC